MDVDVFSPSLPVTPTTPQIKHDHLIPQIRSDDELGELVCVAVFVAVLLG